MSPPARLVIADDHAYVRAGARAMLSGESDLAIVGEAAKGQEAVALCQRVHPDLVLLNLHMPDDTLQVIAAIRQACPRTRVVVYTFHVEPEYLTQLQEAGAAGYVLKEASHQELVTAIRRVLQGERLF